MHHRLRRRELERKWMLQRQLAKMVVKQRHIRRERAQKAAEAPLPAFPEAAEGGAVFAADDPQGAVLAAMGRSAHMDEIIERTGLPADIVLAALTMLELQGLIAQRPGNYYEKQR